MGYGKSFRVGFLLAGVLFAATACEDEAIRKPKALGEMPETVAVSGGTVVVGLTGNQLRGTERIADFRLAKHPVTVGRYAACVAAGACSPALREGCHRISSTPLGGPTAESTDTELPATCVGVQQAEQFCAWVGGTLPTLARWLAAARGSEPQTHAWGTSAATCEQHPEGVLPKDADPEDPRWRGICGREPELYRIGKHPAGAARSGIQDVLLSGGELVKTSSGSVFQACEAPERDACAVTSRSPGSIDAVVSIDAKGAAPGEQPPPATVVYSFRCAWEAQ